ncbi:unnamed protein product [Cochlearia groenlandica]
MLGTRCRILGVVECGCSVDVSFSLAVEKQVFRILLVAPLPPFGGFGLSYNSHKMFLPILSSSRTSPR